MISMSRFFASGWAAPVSWAAKPTRSTSSVSRLRPPSSSWASSSRLLISLSRRIALRRIRVNCRCWSSLRGSRSSSSMPSRGARMRVSGVRSSWLMLAKKRLLSWSWALSASLASASSWISSSRGRVRSLTRASWESLSARRRSLFFLERYSRSATFWRYSACCSTRSQRGSAPGMPSFRPSQGCTRETARCPRSTAETRARTSVLEGLDHSPSFRSQADAPASGTSTSTERTSHITPRRIMKLVPDGS